MSPNQIARALLERRNTGSPVIMQGEMQKLIGPDGMAEALRRSWFTIDHDMGTMQVTNLHSRLEEIRHLAETYQVGDAVVVAEGGKSFNGTVSKVNQDGTFSVSFGDVRPGVVKPSYAVNELRAVGDNPDGKVMPVPQSVAPPLPGVSAVTGPRGPGIG